MNIFKEKDFVIYIDEDEKFNLVKILEIEECIDVFYNERVIDDISVHDGYAYLYIFEDDKVFTIPVDSNAETLNLTDLAYYLVEQTSSITVEQNQLYLLSDVVGNVFYSNELALKTIENMDIIKEKIQWD